MGDQAYLDDDVPRDGAEVATLVEYLDSAPRSPNQHPPDPRIDILRKRSCIEQYLDLSLIHI